MLINQNVVLAVYIGFAFMMSELRICHTDKPNPMTSDGHLHYIFFSTISCVFSPWSHTLVLHKQWVQDTHSWFMISVCTCTCISIVCVTLVLYSEILLDRLKRRRGDWKPEKRRWNSRDYIRRRELEEHWRELRLSLRKRYAYFMYSLFYFHLLFIRSTDVVMHVMSTLWKSGYMTFVTAEISKVERCMYIEMLFYP